MPTFRMRSLQEPDDILKKRRATDRTGVTEAQPVYPAGFQRTIDDVSSLSPANVLQLQRSVGNRAVEQLLVDRDPGQAADTGELSIQRSLEQEEEQMELACPGSKINSAGQGRGEGTGEGRGPMGYPKDEEW